jgi:hypothetical protein
MKRRLFNMLVTVSLLLCVSLTALFIRGFWVTDVLMLRRYIVVSSKGKLGLNVFFNPQSDVKYFVRGPTDPFNDFMEGATLGGNPYWYWHGIGYAEYGDAALPEHCLLFILPEWLLIAATSLPPLAWAYTTTRRHQRTKHGQCQNCGYDLRATSERCPECGMVPKSSMSANRNS